MKITLDNRDTENIHIDTYAMLTGDSADEMMRYNAREDGIEDSDSLDIDYDMPEIVKELAHASINIVSQETAHDKIIESITFVKSGSPRFYNYTTDYYIADYEVDTVKLHEYIASHYDEVRAIAEKYDDSVVNGEVSKESLAHAGLCHYIDHTITADDYNMAMWEIESEVYYEHMTFSK